MKPRWYQNEAIEQFFDQASRHPRDDLALVLPTGAGKTVVMAHIIERVLSWGCQVVTVARTKELLNQNVDKFLRVNPHRESDVGVYCAGLGMKEHNKPAVFASAQSSYRKPELFGKRKLVIIDECHQVPMDEGSQYQQLIGGLKSQEPTCKLLGLTASPYRLDGGVIFGKGQQFHRIAYSVPLLALIEDGFIVRPETLKVKSIDLAGVRKVAGEFSAGEVESRFLGNSITKEVLQCANAKQAKSVLVFASGVAHAEVIRGELEAMGEIAHVVTGDTLPLIRDSSIQSFSSRGIRWLVNVNCLTTGFDAPCVDMIVVARATESPGLFLQMVGRGFRLYPGKDRCWILDYGSNVERHGPVDSEAYGIDTIKPASSGEGDPPTKICPRCFEENPAGVRKCIRCEFEWPAKPKVFVAGTADVIQKPKVLPVLSTEYSRWKGKDGKRDTLRVTHKCEDPDAVMGVRYVSRWVCIEHDGYARERAYRWWRSVSRSDFPETIDEALETINTIGIADILTIEVVKDGKWDRITSQVAGEAPDPVPADWGYEPDSIPF